MSDLATLPAGSPEPTAPPAQPGEPAKAPEPTARGEKLRAVGEAVLAKITRRRPGQRGPDKAPRQPRVSLAEVAGGARPLVLETPPPPAPLAVEWEPAPDLRAEAAEKVVAGLVSQFDKAAGALVYLLGIRWTRDKAAAAAAREAASMDAETKAGLTSGGAYVWEKYLGTITDAREAAFWVVLGSWLGLQVGGSVLQLQQARVDKEDTPCPPSTS